MLGETQRSLRVAQRQGNCPVQRMRIGDALLRYLAAQVDDAGHDALTDEPRRIVDHLHRHAVATQRLPRLGFQRGVERRRTHQHVPPFAIAKQVVGDATRRRQTQTRDHRAGVLTQRSDQADGPFRRRLTRLQLRTRLAQQGCQPTAQLGVLAVQPERAVHRDWLEGRRRRSHLLAIVVAVIALAALAPEQTGGDPLRCLVGRRIAWVLVELLVHRLHHGVRDVQAGEVEQFERPHAKARAVAQDAVDLLGISDALGEDALRLGAVGATGMVDQKTGSIRCDRREMPGLFGQLDQPLDHLRIAALAAHHFHQLHQRHRVEEMKTGHPLRVPAGRGDPRDRQ